MAQPQEYEMLDPEQLAAALDAMPGWERDGEAIAKLFSFDSYMDGVEFARRVAEAAEEMNHHPDMHVGFKQVRVRCWTHKKNAVTRADLTLAGRIEKLAGR